MRLRTYLFICLLLLAGSTQATTFKQGLAAFKAEDYADAFRIWTPLAQQGDAQAEYGLSLLYAQGLGVAADTDYAFILMRSAAEGGVAQAQLNMGNHYNAGRWVRRSPKRAAFWWRQAAEKDVVAAMYNLGTLHYYGRGVALDRLKARFWFERGAKLDCSRCAQALAIMDKQDAEAERSAATPPASDADTPADGAVQPIATSSAEPTAAAKPEVQPGPAVGSVVPLRAVVGADAGQPKGAHPQPKARSAPKPNKPEPKPALAHLPEPPASAARPRPVPATNPGNVWVLSQPPSNYTVQLFASDKPESVHNYRVSHPWGPRLLVFRFKYLGRAWEALVFGSFPDKHSAQIMAARTPSPHGAGRPWVRNLGTMQSLLTKP